MGEQLNLYETLFPDDDEQDIGMLAINDMYDHLNFEKLSNYVDIKGYNSSLIVETGSNALSIIHFNIRSLPTNLHHLEVLLVSFTQLPDIIVLTETWLTKDKKDTINLNGYYSFNLVRDQKLHGGVSIYIKQNIDTKLLEKFSFIPF